MMSKTTGTIRILIVYPDVSVNIGILKKISKKVKSLQAMPDVEVTLMVFGRSSRRERLEVFGLRDVVYCDLSEISEPRLLKIKMFWPLLQQYKRYQELQKIQKAIVAQPADVILMRDFRACWYSDRFLKTIERHAPAVVEINTNLEEELKMIADRDGASEWDQLEYHSEKRFRKRQFQQLQAVSAVSQELLDQHQSLLPNDAKTTVIANGFDVDSTQMSEVPHSSEAIRAVFLAGSGDSGYKFERIEQSAKVYQCKHPLIIDVYGMDKDAFQHGEITINYHQHTSGDELDDAMNGVHFGISTMGLYQKNLYEASTLKVREYLSRGIPVLLGYTDTDISNDRPFVYRVENDPSLIDFESVVAWARELYQNPSVRGDCRTFAKSAFAFEAKCDALVEFLRSV